MLTERMVQSQESRETRRLALFAESTHQRPYVQVGDMKLPVLSSGPRESLTYRQYILYAGPMSMDSEITKVALCPCGTSLVA